MGKVPASGQIWPGFDMNFYILENIEGIIRRVMRMYLENSSEVNRRFVF